MKRVDTSPFEILKKQVEYLQSSKKGSPTLSSVEVGYILKSLSSRPDKIGLAVTRLLETMGC